MLTACPAANKNLKDSVTKRGGNPNINPQELEKTNVLNAVVPETRAQITYPKGWTTGIDNGTSPNCKVISCLTLMGPGGSLFIFKKIEDEKLKIITFEKLTEYLKSKFPDRKFEKVIIGKYQALSFFMLNEKDHQIADTFVLTDSKVVIRIANDLTSKDNGITLAVEILKSFEAGQETDNLLVESVD